VGWAGWSGIAQTPPLLRVDRVGQGAQECAVLVEDLHNGAVEADDDALAGQVVADRVLPAGEADKAAGADEPVDLDRAAGFGGQWWRSGDLAAVGEQLAQVRRRES
jgi:hypothetical protein